MSQVNYTQPDEPQHNLCGHCKEPITHIKMYAQCPICGLNICRLCFIMNSYMQFHNKKDEEINDAKAPTR